ncbi:MAG TPA: AI-2E family transporter, partial [Phycisphaerae bacterium]|nr:AI-2E family transporter [Phycisphaerae bacterium]
MPTIPILPVVKPPMSYTQKVMIAVGISGAAILLALFLASISQILVLCFAGLLFSVFLSAPADLLAKYAKIQRTYALLLVLGTFAIIVLGGGSLMGYTITRQSQELARTLPVALKQVEHDLEKRL